jgi:hypothetical protein
MAFLDGFPTFVSGFLLSTTPFYFLQRLSTFRDAFQLSATAFRFASKAFQFSSTAFHFQRNPRNSIDSPFWGNALVLWQLDPILWLNRI